MSTSEAKPPRAWIESHWRVRESAWDRFSSDVAHFGSLGLIEEKSEPREGGCLFHLATVYFPLDRDIATLETQLTACAPNDVVFLNACALPEGDWATAWKQYFHPFSLTSHCVVAPSWEPYTPQAGEQVITLDPGMAFGTGKHDSTRFAAELIAETFAEKKGPLSLLDVGTGSGILAFLANTLGFKSVVGIDTDPIAIEVATQNAVLNPKLRDVSFALSTEGLEFSGEDTRRFDVISANIIAEVLIALKPALLARLNPGGILILSGIIPEREQSVREAFSDLVQAGERRSGEWVGLSYRNGRV